MLEILIVIAILAGLSAAGAGYFHNTVTTIESQATSKTLMSDIKNVRAKSMAGENNMKWGIRAVNSADDYYEIFSTPTNYIDVFTAVHSTTTLPRGVIFTDPGEGLNKEIIFSKISGTATAMTLSLSSLGDTATITVTAQGTVY